MIAKAPSMQVKLFEHKTIACITDKTKDKIKPHAVLRNKRVLFLEEMVHCVVGNWEFFL